MNIKNFNYVQEFLKVFMNERKISQTELAESLNYTSSYINQILSGKKSASEGFFKTFCESFTEFKYEDCLELIERDKEERKARDSQEDTISTTEQAKDSSNLNRNIQEQTAGGLIQTSENTEILELLQLLKNNQHVQSLVRKISNHSEEIQADIEEQVDNFLESTISNLIPRYTHKELKDLLLKTTSIWVRKVISPGYDLVEAREQGDLAIEGHLHLSNTALFFTLNVTNEYISLTTRYQDRTHMEEFIKLVPGWVHRESITGSLGSIYKNVPLLIVRIFNLSDMALKVRSLLSSFGASLQNIEIESSSVESYFK
jgi:transcriptional regulator with XRE-family HTH domain